LQHLIQYHKSQSRQSCDAKRHDRAIARLQKTMTGAAMAFENEFKHI
jgi:hypothetical protein